MSVRKVHGRTVRSERWPGGKPASWPRGPWDHEPDLVTWTDATTGFPCLLMRSEETGVWCGYVGLPPSHPLHGRPLSDVTCWERAAPHGGVTYADDATHPAAVGHAPQAWWVGFDCLHAHDVTPSTGRSAIDPGTYRDLEYAFGETERLAGQLAGLGACTGDDTSP